MEKCGVTHIVIPSPDMRQLPIIPLDNVHYFRKKNLTIYSCTSLKTETSKMNKLNSYPKLQSKYKKSTTSYLDVASSWVSTEVDYTTVIDPKPKIEELNNMGHSEKICFWKNIEQK